MENETSIFDAIDIVKLRRRQLLPWWIKVFCWFFMLFGVLAAICLLIGLFGFHPALSLYGFETNQPYSLAGLMITGLGIFKGIVSYNLWFEKDMAIKMGKIDAILGIGLCLVSMIWSLVYAGPNAKFSFRLELILLIPYLIKLIRITPEWDNGISERSNEDVYTENEQPFIE